MRLQHFDKDAITTPVLYAVRWHWPVRMEQMQMQRPSRVLPRNPLETAGPFSFIVNYAGFFEVVEV